jgi:O-antigen/teichoic acid export membrane protein
MITLTKTPALNNLLARAKTYGSLITIVGSAQMLIQLVGFVSGIFIIRTLSTGQYALYTLANTMLGTMTLLADGGIGMGVMSQGGKVWQDRALLGRVVATGLFLRKRFAVLSIAIAIPILIYLLRLHNASWLVTALITLSIIPAFLMALSGEMLEIVPRLRQDIKPLQKIQIGTSIRRLGLLLLTLFVFPWSFVAILAAGLPQIWANLRLRKITAEHADIDQPEDPAVSKEIFKLVRNILPGAIYFCLSGQITIWLVSVFGSTKAVAQVGALNRIAVLLTVISVLITTLIAPRFARLANVKKLLLSRYLLIVLGLFILCAFIIGFVYLFQGQFLWVLGNGYKNLKIELVLSLTGSCLALIAGTNFSMYANRGWAMNPLFIIPFNIAVIIVGALLINISTLKGVLLLNIFIGAVEVLVGILYTVIKITAIKPAI